MKLEIVTWIIVGIITGVLLLTTLQYVGILSLSEKLWKGILLGMAWIIGFFFIWRIYQDKKERGDEK